MPLFKSSEYLEAVGDTPPLRTPALLTAEPPLEIQEQAGNYALGQPYARVDRQDLSGLNLGERVQAEEVVLLANGDIGLVTVTYQETGNGIQQVGNDLSGGSYLEPVPDIADIYAPYTLDPQIIAPTVDPVLNQTPTTDAGTSDRPPDPIYNNITDFVTTGGQGYYYQTTETQGGFVFLVSYYVGPDGSQVVTDMQVL